MLLLGQHQERKIALSGAAGRIQCGPMNPGANLLRSRKQIKPFRLHAPASIQDALDLQEDPSVLVMAGGIEVIDRLKRGMAPKDILWLGHVGELSGIETDGKVLRLGAMTSYGAAIASALVSEHVPDLASALGGLGNPRVRHQGTLGGGIMSGVLHFDVTPILAALDAHVLMRSRAGGEIALDPISVLRSTPAAIMTVVEIPLPAPHFIFLRSDKPAFSVAVALSSGPDRPAVVRTVVTTPDKGPLRQDLMMPNDGSPDARGRTLAAIWRHIVQAAPGTDSYDWYTQDVAQVRIGRLTADLARSHHAG